MPRNKKDFSEKYNSAFATQLRKAFEDGKAAGLTQAKLAAELGVTAQAVSKWYNGENEPQLSILPKIADYFGTSVDWLLGKTNVKAPDISNRMICEKTGLTEETIHCLEAFSREDNIVQPFVPRFFEDMLIYHGTKIEEMNFFVCQAAHARVVWDNNHQKANSESDYVDNLIAAMNGETNGYYKLRANDASDFFKNRAKRIAEASVREVIDWMFDDLVEYYTNGGFVSLEERKIAWRIKNE